MIAPFSKFYGKIYIGFNLTAFYNELILCTSDSNAIGTFCKCWSFI